MNKSDFRHILPPIVECKEQPVLPASRQITIVGGAAAGKSLFMQKMIQLCGEKAYCVSALRAPYPEKEVSTMAGSIDMQYRDAVRSKSYMRSDAVSELDKLAYMLFVDEFEDLLRLKEQFNKGGRVRSVPTRLDRLQQLWQHIYPGNRIVRVNDRMMFANRVGNDLIGIDKLSQGETCVLYYIAAVLYAPYEAVIFIDQPSLLIHPSIVGTLWNSLEELRPDCRFVYDTVDVDFVSSRTENVCVWVKSYDSDLQAWDYEVLAASNLSEDLLVGLVGTRKPVMFIEGDVEHSIDLKLYRLVFTDYTVRPLGSCNKVIETTRTFNDLRYLHHLESHGIVDRDRRSDDEVAYLRRKNIFVPNVAEVENIFMLPSVLQVMARRRGKDPEKVVSHVKKNVMYSFSQHYDEQALQHVRHKVKRDVECKIDARFTCITAMENHLQQLVDQLQPRENYMRLRSEFVDMLGRGDYEGVLRVFNHKPLLGECGVVRLLGYTNCDDYIAGVLSVLKGSDADSDRMRAAIKYCFGLGPDDIYVEPLPEAPSRAEKRKLNREPQSPDSKPKSRKSASGAVNRKRNNHKLTRAQRREKREQRAEKRRNR